MRRTSRPLRPGHEVMPTTPTTQSRSGVELRGGAARQKATQHFKIGSAVVLATAILYIAFGQSPEVWPGEYGPKADDVHWKLGMATGTTSLLLFAAALSVTPVLNTRGNVRRRVHIPIRRALGVWTASIALIHATLGITLHSEGWKLYGPYLTLFRRTGVGRVFGAALWISSAALALLVLLALISNPRGMQRLGARRWKRIQRLAYPTAGLVLLHIIGIQWWEGRYWPFIVATWTIPFAVAALRTAARSKADLAGSKAN